MKNGNMILAGILAVGMSLSLSVPVLAEEQPQEGILDTLKAVGEQIREKGAPLYEGAGMFLDSMKNEDGKIDWDKVSERLNELGGAVTGDDFDDVDAYIAEYEKIYRAIDQYVLDMHKDTLPGDVPILSKAIAYTDYDVFANEIKVLGEFTQMNFTAEDDQLAFSSSSSIPMLFTLVRRDGGFEVKEAKQAEDGEGFAASVKGFCDEVGITKEEYDEAMEFSEYHVLNAMMAYMDEHPEIRCIEYIDGFCTREDLEKMSDAILNELFPAE